MRELVWSHQFKRDVRASTRRGKDLEKLNAVLKLLVEGQPLPAALRDHPTKGEWKGLRNLHLEPDWLLLYSADATEIRLIRTGTHSDLFGS